MSGQPSKFIFDIPPGLNSDDTTFAAAGAWIDACNMRFRLGQPQCIGGWERITADLLTGVCRAAFAWTDNSAVLNVGFGTHSKLQLWQGGTLYDITPLGPPTLLTAAPLSVTNASAVVTVKHAAHGLPNGTNIIVSGAVAIGGITPNGGPFAITVLDVDRYTFTFTSNATSTVAQPPGGGGSAVVVTPQIALAAGAIDGTGTSGFGTGTYGTGAYGSPSTSDYFPRTWSLAAWGQNLLASPRNGGLYKWSNSTAAAAVAVPAAPVQITQMLVAPTRQVFALGCTQENGTYNPLCLRHSGVGDETQWASDATSSSTAREYILTGGGRIVGGLFLGRNLLVWTTHALFLGTFVGDLNKVWSFDRVALRCGLIGPNAAAALGLSVFWMSPDRQFHAYSVGGEVSPVPCTIRNDFAANLSPSQADKIIASSIAEHGEVRWDYPDARDGAENSRYLALPVKGPDAGSWYRGRTLNGVASARTAMVDAGPATYPIGVTSSGQIYWHEKGKSADGAAFAWSIKSGDIYVDPNVAALVTEVIPNFSADRAGAVSLTIGARDQPDAAETSYGPYAIALGDTRVPVKVAGRLFSLAYSGYAAPSYARLGKLQAKVKPRGRKS